MAYTPSSPSRACAGKGLAAEESKMSHVVSGTGGFKILWHDAMKK
jgi:hypothetical protein